MPGGLLPLVAYGAQNIVVNGNPDFTYFRKTFMRHTHFSTEPIQIELTGPNEMAMDAPTLLKAKIPRHGDLVRDMVLRFSLPDIYSKVYQDNSENLVRTPYEFAWVRQIGIRLIDRVTLTIGGSKIQEFSGDWIATRAALDLDNTQYAKWQYLVGDVPELFDPANGIYADPSGGLYPNVIKWTTPNVQQINAPSIPGRELRIPLAFFFSDDNSNALPLVALQYHEVEIQLLLRPIRDLYTINDPSGVRLRYGLRSLPYIESDQYTSVWNPSLYGPLPQTLNNRVGTYNDPSGALRHFLTDFYTSPPLSDGWPINASLETTYVYLTEPERMQFASKPLSYICRQVQYFNYDGISNRDFYDIYSSNLMSRLVWIMRRSDSITSRNDWTNLTNWIYSQSSSRPMAYPLVGQTVPTTVGRSGLFLQGLQRNILKGGRLLGNGNELFAYQNQSYFRDYQLFKNIKGGGFPYELNGLLTQTSLWPIFVYSFAMNGSDPIQPSGTINTSRFNSFQLDLDVEPIPTGAFYTYDLTIFAETYNFVEFTNGMAGLKYAI
jgi:hypothetical protein